MPEDEGEYAKWRYVEREYRCAHGARFTIHKPIGEPEPDPAKYFQHDCAFTKIEPESWGGDLA
jgi:hypothetical protein